MSSLTLRRTLVPLACLTVAALASTASAQVVSLFGSTGYLTGGDVYTSASGTHRASATFVVNNTSTTSGSRALSTDANYSVNGGTLTGPGAAGYTGTMPAAFVGFTSSSSGASMSSSLTTRVQFQNNAGGDFLHVNTYQESGSNTLAAGLNLRTAAAVMFSAGATVDLGNLSVLNYAAGATAYASGTTATHRVIVRDALSGNFFVSSANNTAATGAINLASSDWASVSASTLTSVGSFAAATFTQFDYVGIYSDSSVTTAVGITGYTRVNGFTVSELSYTAIPEPGSASALAGTVVLFGALGLRRRRRA